MKKWRNLIQSHHDWAHKDDEYKLVTRPAASADDIAKVEVLFGFSLPEEFHELYLTYDGVGVEGYGDTAYWMFTPLGELPNFVEETRDWFQETHPDAAKRYFPFIDWSKNLAWGASPDS